MEKPDQSQSEISITSGSDTTIGGDAVGRDKNVTQITNVAIFQGMPHALSRSEQGYSQTDKKLQGLSLFDAPKFSDNVTRPKLIARLQELARSKPVVAVEGLSGCGKSYLVSAWLEEPMTLAAIQSVLWYDPQVNDSLGGLLAQMETQLNLTALSITSKCKQLLNYLKQQNAILVIDNFEQVEQASYSVLISLAARQGIPASIFLISREYVDFIHNLPHIGHLEVRGFDLEAIQEFLTGRGVIDKTSAYIPPLLEKTDGLPLAASLFATLVLDFGCSPDDLLTGTMLSSTRLHKWFGDILAKIENEENKLLRILSLSNAPFNRGVIRMAGQREKIRDTDLVFEGLQRKYLVQSYTPYRWNVQRLIAGFCQSEMQPGEKRAKHLAFAKHYAKGIDLRKTDILTKDDFNWLIIACRHFQNARKYKDSERILKCVSKTVKTYGHYEIFIALGAIEIKENHKRSTWIDYDYAHCCFITGQFRKSLEVIEPLFYSVSESEQDKRVAISRLYAELLGSMGKDSLALHKLREALQALDEKSIHPTILSHARSIEVWLLTKLGNYEAASHICQELLADSSRRADKRGGAVALTRWGLLERFSENYMVAYQKFSEAITLFREVEDKRGLGWSLANLAIVEIITAHKTEALEHLTEGLRIYMDTGVSSIDYFELLEEAQHRVLDEKVAKLIESELERVRSSFQGMTKYPES